KGLKAASYFCTRNYRYNYYRPEDNLIYLKQGETVLKIMDFFREELMTMAQIPEQQAQRLSSELIRRRIAQLATLRVHRHEGFAQNMMFRSKEIQSQYALFHDLFKRHSKYRDRMLE